MSRALAAAVALLGACSQPPPPAPVRPPAPTTPTTVATTTTAAVRAPSAPVRVPPPPEPVRADPAGAVAARGDVWSALSACESGHRNLRNPPYSGYLQFTRPTWRSMGESGEAADYPYEYQRDVAIRLQARSGWGNWPACSRKLGLR